MEKKKLIKKICLIISLILIIGGIGFIIGNASAGKKEQKFTVNTPGGKEISQENVAENATQIDDNEQVEEIAQTDETVPQTETVEAKDVIKTDLGNGIKYSLSNDEIKPEIVVGDSFFDTQVRDMSLNFDQYEGKTIEIEGLYFENAPFTFVGRYSTSNMCPTCPTGYSYFEYEWHGKEKFELSDSQNWIKIVGTLKRGFDDVEYYYIDAQSISLMKEKGMETVSN